jgi:hypothetical protein
MFRCILDEDVEEEDPPREKKLVSDSFYDSKLVIMGERNTPLTSRDATGSFQ